ncbi:MAG TPA: hypothetical protein PKI61_00695 [bacterium]|nr:hypothetical protein [bacterium]HPT29402.1 hypothetical protein [bacterium]
MAEKKNLEFRKKCSAIVEQLIKALDEDFGNNILVKSEPNDFLHSVILKTHKRLPGSKTIVIWIKVAGGIDLKYCYFSRQIGNMLIEELPEIIKSLSMSQSSKKDLTQEQLLTEIDAMKDYLLSPEMPVTTDYLKSF